jgi:putative FmdB family regulatory protein
MPIYEYKCNGCGMHMERRQSVTEEPLKICESCGGELEKQWSLSGFQFKGDGWYVTDYSKSKEAATKSDPPGSPSTKEKPASPESTPTTSTASNVTTEKRSEAATKKD